MAGGGAEARGADALPGLACALMWGVSPVLTVRGLEGLDSPLLGVALGLVAAVAAYGGFLLARRGGPRPGVIAFDALAFKVIAGVLVALATWWRWIAIDGADVAVVVSLGLLSVPVVLFLSPLLVGKHLERVTPRVWAGAGLVVGGALALIAVDMSFIDSHVHVLPEGFEADVPPSVTGEFTDVRRILEQTGADRVLLAPWVKLLGTPGPQRSDGASSSSRSSAARRPRTSCAT